MKRLFFLLLLAPVVAGAQRPATKEVFLDPQLRPVSDPVNARYYAVITPKEDHWRREAYFIEERSLAHEGDFLDSACTRPTGEHHWFHPNRKIESLVQYRDGYRQGAFLRFDDKGHMIDSAQFDRGHILGVRLGWNGEGYLTDSAHFDGKGNGVQVRFYPGGSVRSAGRVVSDTAWHGRWIFYHEDGSQLANVVYEQDSIVSCRCWDEKGVERDPGECRPREAEFPGGSKAWIRYLQEHLEVPRGIRAGTFTVWIRFVVDEQGKVVDMKAMSRLGAGLEEAVEYVLRRSPRWTPGRQWGRPVRAYRTQPVTFSVTE